MSEAPRAPLRLLLQGLSEADAVRVARFLSLGRDRLSHSWQLVADGDVQVVIVDGLEVDTIFGMVEPPLATLYLVDANDPRFSGDASPLGPEQRLTRPLQYEALLDALCVAERIWQAVNQPGVPLAGSATGASRPHVPLQMRPMPPIPGPGNVAPVSVPVTMPGALQESGPQKRSFTLDPRSTFRLRRWPPAELLMGDRDKYRLATFLSSRGVDLAQLTRLSNVPRDKCLDFLARMAAADLLTIKPIASAAPPLADERAAPAAAAATPKVDSSLLSRLRRRLGIGWA